MPRFIGKYEIEKKIGAGGMAAVYKAIQPSLKRPVAIKVLSHKLSGKDAMIRRFQRESMIVARLAHPNIIHIIDRGETPDGLPYFVMDCVEGVDLQKIIRDGGRSLIQKMEIMVQVCKALAYAHKNNVVHRDIKPANVLIDNDGNAMVADFGIAQLVDEALTDGGLTREGMVLGTLSYMSPEQSANAKAVTPASDIYSLGVVMYELLTGVKPTGYFKPPSELAPDVSKPLEDLILQCLSPEPRERPDGADAVKDVLLEELKGAHLKEATRKSAALGVSREEDSLVLLDVIKEHAYGAVYLFRRRVSGKLMVVKKYSAPSGGLAEARLFTSLRHKNIVDVAGASGNESIYIVAMEYISGGNLEDRLVRPYEWQEALRILKGICQGLSFAWKNRVIHGNLRPSNVMITEDGLVKLTDFGLNEHYGNNDDQSNWYNPFQDPKSHLTDIFSAGAILHRMLTGSPPAWDGDEFVEHPGFDEIPRPVADLVLKMLSRDPGQNFSRVDQVIQAADDILQHHEKTRLLAEEQAATPRPAPSQEPDPAQLRRAQWLRVLLFAVFVETVLYYLWTTDQAAPLAAFWADLIARGLP